jgi:hypothetical protein
MNTGDKGSEEYNLVGEGFSSFAEAKNPKEYTRQYVHEKSERSDVVGYAPSISYSADMYSGDPCVERVAKAADEEQVGNDAHVDIVTVNLWENVAFKRTYAIIPDGKGDGTEALIYTGTLKAVGEVAKGTFDAATKKFTPATA